MSAVNVVTLGDIMDNLEFQCSCSLDLLELGSVIHDYRITNPSIADLEVVQAISNEWLKRLTGCMVGSGTDLNCYPVGLTDTLCFDLDGNPL
jgi:hypothetical protein